MEASFGGFGGGGLFLLGGGKDKCFGFGDITMNGGPGVDLLVLPGFKSDYTISPLAGGASYRTNGITMNTFSFEGIMFMGST